MSTGNFCCWIWKVVISLETAVWCSALHTTNNMETGLGVAKLWVQPRYERSVGCLIQIRRGFGRTALNQRWGKGLHWGVQVFWEGESDRSEIQWRTEMERFRWERLMWATKGQWERRNKRRCYTGAPWNYTQRPKHRNKRIPKCRLKTGGMSWNNLLFFTEYIELLILRKSNQSRNKIKQESAPRAPQVPSAPTRP